MKNCSGSFEYVYNSKSYCISLCDFFQHTKIYNYISDDGKNKCVDICKSLNKENYEFSRIDEFCGENCLNEGVQLFHDNNNICFISYPKYYMCKEETKECVSCIDSNLYIDKDGNWKLYCRLFTIIKWKYLS